MSVMRTNQIQSQQSGRLHAHHRPVCEAVRGGINGGSPLVHSHKKSSLENIIVREELQRGSTTAATRLQVCRGARGERREIHESRLLTVI